MKKKYQLLFLLSIILFMTSGNGYAQANKTKATQPVVKLKDGGVYKFTATNMYPMKGRPRNLTSNYELVFSKDTLYGSLPYIGEAYMADYSSIDGGGVQLQTAKFTYTETSAKKQTYIVKYKIQEQDVSNATFTIYPDGTADLQLIFLKREGISYRGTVTGIKKQ